MAERMAYNVPSAPFLCFIGLFIYDISLFSLYTLFSLLIWQCLPFRCSRLFSITFCGVIEISVCKGSDGDVRQVPLRSMSLLPFHCVICGLIT